MPLDWLYNISTLVIVHLPPSPTNVLECKDALRLDVKPSSLGELEI